MDLNKYVKLHILSDLSPTDHLYRWVLKIPWYVTISPVTMSLTVGDKFQSFALWEEAVKKYELENYVQLWRREARTIQAAKKRLTSTTDRQFNEDLQYYDTAVSRGEGSILQEQLEAVPTHQLYEVNAAFKSGLESQRMASILKLSPWIRITIMI